MRVRHWCLDLLERMQDFGCIYAWYRRRGYPMGYCLRRAWGCF